MTDTRRFNILSSFSVDTDAGRAHNQSGNVSSFIAINKPSKQAMRLIFAGKSLIMYDYDKNYNPHCADEYTSIGCRYIK